MLLFAGKGLEMLVPRVGRDFRGLPKLENHRELGLDSPWNEGRLGVVFWHPYQHSSTPAGEFEGSREGTKRGWGQK